MHILFFHPNYTLAQHWQKKLRYENISSDLAMSYDNVITCLLKQAYQAAVICHEPPEVDAFEACDKIKSLKPDLPLAILCQKVDKLLESLANLKGIRLILGTATPWKNLVNTIKNIANFQVITKEDRELNFSDLVLNLETRIVKRGQQSFLLRNKEFSLLEFFMRHPGVPLQRNLILERIWDNNIDILTNTVDVHVSQLRKKIDLEKFSPLIKTIHCVGYMFGEGEAN